MTDTFGDWWDDDQGGETATQTGEQPMLPDGKHVGKIVVAEVRDIAFKTSDRNPKGKTLSLKVAVNGYQLAEDLIPVQMKGVIGGVCLSAGIEAPTKGETFEAFCSRLKGQTAPIETTHVVAPSGREYIRVKWLPGVKPAPASRKAETRGSTPPAAKSAKPATPIDEAPDDIPF